VDDWRRLFRWKHLGGMRGSRSSTARPVREATSAAEGLRRSRDRAGSIWPRTGHSGEPDCAVRADGNGAYVEGEGDGAVDDGFRRDGPRRRLAVPSVGWPAKGNSSSVVEDATRMPSARSISGERRSTRWSRRGWFRERWPACLAGEIAGIEDNGDWLRRDGDRCNYVPEQSNRAGSAQTCSS